MMLDEFVLKPLIETSDLNALYGVITLDDHNMVFVTSGQGDGQYDVEELWLPDRVAGIEISFIDPENLSPDD